MKFKFKRHIRNITLCALASAALAAVPFKQANAVDYKTYSGGTCQATYGNQEGWFNKYSSGIQNVSTSTRWITCAPVKDRAGSIGTYNAWVYINYAFTNTTLRTYCYLYERNSVGGAVQTRIGSRSSSGWINLDTSASINSFYVTRSIYCNLPRGVLVSTVEVGEH